jgi:diguanylate cyclase (GGDEF)-like protein
MIQLTKKLLIQALECDLTGMVIVNAQKRGWPIIYVNPVIEAWSGWDASELIGRDLNDLVCNGDLPEFPWGKSRQLTQQWTGKNGEPVDARFELSPLYDRPGEPACLLLCQRPEPETYGDDIDARSADDELRNALKDARIRLKRMESLDSATGLPNRKAFMEILQRDWGVARRENRRIGVIAFQVTDLESYRDLFGRHAAESSLRKIAHAISGSLRREGDVAARLDNDKFIALIGSADEDHVDEFAERIAAKVRDLSIHHPRSNDGRFLTVSYGVASEIPEWTAPCSVLVEQAEEQLIAATEEPAAREKAG